MSNRDRVLDFLRRAGHAGATNEEILSHTGIRPHQQVFAITRDLLSQGSIKGIRAGKEWRFWITSQASPKARSESTEVAPTQEIRLKSELTPLDFERKALAAMNEALGTRLAPGQLPGVPKRFDYVSEDRSIVGDAKFYTLVNGERLPPAKFSIIAEHVWLLEKTNARRKFLVFGNDRRVPEQWLRKYGNLVSGVEFFFVGQTGEAIRLNEPNAS
jgi:hypothetical protein